MRCRPNETLVIAGMFQSLLNVDLRHLIKSSLPVFIESGVGGRAIVCPGVQNLQRIDLTIITLEINIIVFVKEFSPIL